MDKRDMHPTFCYFTKAYKTVQRQKTSIHLKNTHTDIVSQLTLKVHMYMYLIVLEEKKVNITKSSVIVTIGIMKIKDK